MNNIRALVIFFIVLLIVIPCVYAAPMSRLAILVAETKDTLPADGSVSVFLKKHEQDIYQNLPSVFKKATLKETFQINFAKEEGGSGTKEVGLEDTEFLWEYAVVRALDRQKDRIFVPGDISRTTDGSVTITVGDTSPFLVKVPIVLHGTLYQIIDGTVIVRADTWVVPERDEKDYYIEEITKSGERRASYRRTDHFDEGGREIRPGEIRKQVIPATQVQLLVDLSGNIYY